MSASFRERECVFEESTTNQPFLPCPWVFLGDYESLDPSLALTPKPKLLGGCELQPAHFDKHIYSSESKSSFLQSRGEASTPLKPPPKHLGLIFWGTCLLWFRVPLMNLLFFDCCPNFACKNTKGLNIWPKSSVW